jgi:class 3 adenylate cyclase
MTRMSVPRGGERRPVTALFADIVGSTAIAERMDPEEWSDIIAEAVRLMSTVVDRYDGHVELGARPDLAQTLREHADALRAAQRASEADAVEAEAAEIQATMIAFA